MAIAPHQILENIKQGSYQAFYFLQGEESYFIDRIVDLLEQAIIPEQHRDFNLTILYGREITLHQLLTQVRQSPMGYDKQVVILKEAQSLQDLTSSTGQKLLLHYLEHPKKDTILALAYKNKTLDARMALTKMLEKRHYLVTSPKLNDKQCAKFIATFVSDLNVKIEADAVHMIQEYIGNDLSRITSELEKIRLNLPYGSTITVELMEQHVTFERPFSFVLLQKMVLEKNYDQCIQWIIRYCLSSKANIASPIVAMLYNLFTKLLMVHQNKNDLPQQIALKTGIMPYRVSDYLKASGRYDLKQVFANIMYLHKADLQLKGIGSSNTDEQILKGLIFNLMHCSGRTAN